MMQCSLYNRPNTRLHRILHFPGQTSPFENDAKYFCTASIGFSVSLLSQMSYNLRHILCIALSIPQVHPDIIILTG